MKGDKTNSWMLQGLLLAIVFMLLAASCSKGTTEQTTTGGAGGAEPTVKLTALAPTTDAALGAITYTLEPAEGGYDLKVTAGPEMKETGELYFRLDYDADTHHAYNINVDGIKPDAGVMGLAVEHTPGQIEVGLVAAKIATGPAVRAGDPLVSLKLLNGGADRGTSETGGSDVNKAKNLTLGQNTGGQWELCWDYTNPGDTNQDGQVGIQDLAPIGANYGQSVEDERSDPRRHIDCDGNGVINVGDVVRIGQNYAARVFAYQIEVSQDGETGWQTVGQYLLSEAEKVGGQTIRFKYTFPMISGHSSYIEYAWYRVATLNEDLQFGTPSDPISQAGQEEPPAANSIVVVTLRAENLDPAQPFAHLNSARVIYPSSYEYVPESANAGSFGNARTYPDGIWGSFAKKLLFPPDSMFAITDMGEGKTAIDLGMASLERNFDSAQVLTGDIINFKLMNKGTDPLVIEFQDVDEDGFKRTYYCDNGANEYFFGEHLKYTYFEY